MSSYLFTRSRSNLKLQPRNRRVLPVCCRNLAESATNVTATSTPPQDESTRVRFRLNAHLEVTLMMLIISQMKLGCS